MWNHRAIGICVFGAAVTVAVLSPASVLAQETTVFKISGTGFTPATLTEGGRAEGRITADRKTIVILVRTWDVQDGKDAACRKLLILSNDTHVVSSRSSNECPQIGRGDELEQVVNDGASGEFIVQGPVLIAKACGDNCDTSDKLSPNLSSLYADIWELDERVERRREEEAAQRRWEEAVAQRRREEELERRRRPGPTCTLSGRVLHIDTGEPLAGVGMDLYRSVRNQRPQSLSSNVATTGRRGEFTIDCSSISDSNFPLTFGLHRNDWKSHYIIGPEVERPGNQDGLILRMRHGPAPVAPGDLARFSFSSREEDSTWFVSGDVENVSGRNLACVRLRFKMSTSYQDRQRGIPVRDLGVLEVEIRNLAEGEKRRYRQALVGPVGLGQARQPVLLCK